ncbi:MAG: LysE family translocator [Anaerolineae bacterium]|nr:LysE family translocator [Anaerolineae bacterium]
MDNAFSSLNLGLFIPAAIALILTPGPVVLYIITRSVDQGRKAGLVSVLGLELGNMVHVMAAALGLSALLLSSSLAFELVKYLGAAYLIYLGIRTLRTPIRLAEQEVKRDSLLRIFLQGIVVAVLNPKTALFFFAFLPQFVDGASPHVTLQIVLLGMIMVTIAIISDTMYALLAGTAGRWLRGSLRWLRFQRYLSGTVYIGLGITTALAGGNKK